MNGVASRDNIEGEKDDGDSTSRFIQLIEKGKGHKYSAEGGRSAEYIFALLSNSVPPR